MAPGAADGIAGRRPRRWREDTGADALDGRRDERDRDPPGQLVEGPPRREGSPGRPAGAMGGAERWRRDGGLREPSQAADLIAADRDRLRAAPRPALGGRRSRPPP